MDTESAFRAGGGQQQDKVQTSRNNEGPEQQKAGDPASRSGDPDRGTASETQGRRATGRFYILRRRHFPLRI